MKRYERWAGKILYPKSALLVLLVPASAVGLLAVFTQGLENTALAYAVYPLSAYTLTAAALRAAAFFKEGKRRLHQNPFFHRYFTDLHFKAEISIHLSFGITLIYCIYKAAAGIYYRSAWFGSMAFYYIVLGVVRFLLLHQIRRGKSDPIQMLKQYRLCGWLLLALTAALGAMSFYAIHGNEVIRYPGYMIYAAAGFAFYNLTIAIFNLVRYRKAQNPVYTASKMFSFAAALVSIFFLQTSMFAAFGNGEVWQQHMNMATAACVFLFISGMAAFMIRTGRRAINANMQKTMQR